MFTPSQVIPFFNHDDPWVRDHALRYFEHCHDPSPLTADDYWAVIDSRGQNDQTLGFAADLKHAPGTERSFERRLQALQAELDEPFDTHYQHAARDIDFPLLAAHRDQLLDHARLLPHVREHMALRLQVADQPTGISNPPSDEPSEEPIDHSEPMPTSLAPPSDDWIQPFRRETPKIGRNDPCPCGSGKKYKKCCMTN